MFWNPDDICTSGLIYLFSPPFQSYKYIVFSELTQYTIDMFGTFIVVTESWIQFDNFIGIFVFD